MTLVDAVRLPVPLRLAPLARDLTLVIAGSLLVALTAQLAVRLPWTPVPITGQTLGVLLVGALLGARRGAAALALYLVEGSAGLPFFAGGAGGALHLAGPTGGYLIAFPAAAWIVGALAERGWDRRPFTAAAAMALGTAAIFAAGLLWLSFSLGSAPALAAGLWPFLPGAAIKIGVAASALPVAWGLVGRRPAG